MSVPPDEPPKNPRRSTPPRDRTKHAESPTPPPRIDFQDDLDEQTRQRERAAAWLRDHWTLPANCPVCASNKWTIGDVYELRPFHGGSLVVGGGDPLLPLFPVVCNVCGNTVLINAVVSGVVKRDAETETTEDDETGGDEA